MNEKTEAMINFITKIALISTFLITLFISSCTEYIPNENTAPEDLIQKQEFTNILFDIRLTEVIIRQDITSGAGKHADSITQKYYQYIFNKHEVDQIQFQKSLDYYTNIPLELDEINNAISDSLTKLKAEIKSTK